MTQIKIFSNNSSSCNFLSSIVITSYVFLSYFDTFIYVHVYLFEQFNNKLIRR